MAEFRTLGVEPQVVMHPIEIEPLKRGILVVDDERSMREILAYSLKNAGYTDVYFANDGEEALTRCKELDGRLYLILLDIRMPNMDGLTFFRHLTNCSNHPIAVIALTGYSSSQCEEEFRSISSNNAMAFDYLTKPFEQSTLLSDIERALNTVHARRLMLIDYKGNAIFSEVALLRDQIASIEALYKINAERSEMQYLMAKEHSESVSRSVERIEVIVASINKHQRSFSAEIGMDVLKAAILAVAVLGILRLGIGDVLAKLLAGPK